MEESILHITESFSESPPLINLQLDKYNYDKMEGNDDATVADEIKWLKDQVSKLNIMNKSLKQRLEEVEMYSDELYEFIDQNEKQIHALQQYSRRENIEIIGIPDYVSQRDLEPTVLKLLNSIGIKVQSFHIVACHRLKKDKSNSSSNVIVRFINRKIAIDCLKNRKQLKNSEFRTKFNKSIFIVENLCPFYKTIFKRCETLRNQELISHVYTRNGNIFIKKGSNVDDRPTRILSFEDIDKLSFCEFSDDDI